MTKLSLEDIKKTYLQGLSKNPGKNLSVKAIITVYNESDIVEIVVKKLLTQGISVHIIDNWSTDGSYESLKKLGKQFNELTIERFPMHNQKNIFNLHALLHRVEEISNNSKNDWLIHYDADEIRTSCWPNISLKQGIEIVDDMDYNAIDFTVLDFRPVSGGFKKGTDPESFFKYFEFPLYMSHYLQIKAWKNLKKPIDLSTHGGHDILFEGKKVFPLKFLNKHYSYRSPVQARKKLFTYRISRLDKEEVSKGWHRHYFESRKMRKYGYLWDKNDLIRFDDGFYDQYFLERLTGRNAIKDIRISPYIAKSERLEEELDKIKNSKFYRLWRIYCDFKDKLKLTKS